MMYMGAETASKFELPCPGCGVALQAGMDQIGIACACPACGARFTISAPTGVNYADEKRPHPGPPPRAGEGDHTSATGGGRYGRAAGALTGGTAGQVTAAADAMYVDRTFCFRCLRCDSTLQARVAQAGQTGKCPTCGASFSIPQFNPRTGTATQNADPGDDGENPTPMHAYAAAGQHAPKLVRTDDDTLYIECPVCKVRSPVTSDNCTGCGLPFTLEGATPTPASGPLKAVMGLLLAGSIGIGIIVVLVLLVVVLVFLIG